MINSETDNIEKRGFLDFFEDFEDHRITRQKLYSVAEIFLVMFAAVICGADGWSDVELFGKSKLEELRKYLPFENGIPSDDTFRRFFRVICPKAFEERFIAWTKTLTLAQNEKMISIDGKVSRHSFDHDKKAMHMVSAFASHSKLVLAQTAVDQKSNEITAIPDLLDWLDLTGAIVTIDAMGCQREIAQKIISGGADYILALKGNQSALHDDVKLMFEDVACIKDFDVMIQTDIDGGHGRIETRSCTSIAIPSVLKEAHDWPGLETIIRIDSTREMKKTGDTTQETRHYISSLKNDAARINTAIRSHWAIENSLHYVLDISFRDDDSRIRQGNAPQNVAIIKHAVLNLLQSNKRKRESIKGLRKIAGWDNVRLHEMLTWKF